MKNIFLVLSFFLMIGCKKEEDLNDGNNNNIFQSIEISFVEIGKGLLYNNGIGDEITANLVVRDSTVWQSLLSQIDTNGNVSQDFSETDVDFDNFQILAIFDSIRPHTGFSIEIVSVIEQQDTIKTTYEKTSGDTGYDVLVRPFHIVKIPQINKPISFIE